MNFTNKYNFPSVIVGAVTTVSQKYTRGEADISTTQVCDAPMQKVLKERHSDEIVTDISDMIWSFFGTIGHEILNNVKSDNVIFKEERFYVDIDGWKVSGQPDLFYKANQSNVLADFKVTAKYTFKDGVKPEYVKQLNVYRYMLEEHGHKVDDLQNIVIFRDALSHEEKVGVYPVVRYKLPKIHEYLETRVSDHKQALRLPDEKIPVCTPFERWQDPPAYCVMKEGNVKQTGGNYATNEEVHEWLKELKDKHPKNSYSVKEKPSSPKRCERFCTVSKWCWWWQERTQQQ